MVEHEFTSVNILSFFSMAPSKPIGFFIHVTKNRLDLSDHLNNGSCSSFFSSNYAGRSRQSKYLVCSLQLSVKT